MKILVVEDEVPARAQIHLALAIAVPDAARIDDCDGVDDSCAWLHQFGSPDLMICDIRVSDGLSFDIFDRVQVSCPVIFCTAYDEYWMRALSQNGIDYVLKPIEQARLIQAINKYRVLQGHFARNTEIWSSRQNLNKLRPRARIIAKRGIEFVSLSCEDVAYIMADNKLIVLVDRQGREYLLDKSLVELSQELPDPAFFRANRRFLVSFSAIKGFRSQGKGKIALQVEKASSSIIISQENAKSFRQWFDR